MLVKSHLFTFRYRHKSAKKVSLAGDFNNWQINADQMKPERDGWWVLKKDFLLPGEYVYKFVIDGRSWFCDPLNPRRKKDNQGIYNSLLELQFRERASQFLTRIEKRLQRTRRHWRPGTKREELLVSLDRLLLLPQINNSDIISRYYLYRLSRVLDQIKSERIKRGIRIWQFYNHGILIETPKVVIGLDMVTGKTAWKLFWDISRKVLQDLASLMDILLISHKHSDHLDMELAGRMLLNRKFFLVPNEAEIWFKEKTHISQPERRYHRQGVEIIPHKGSHIYDPAGKIKLLYYELRLPGDFTLLHTADHDYTLGVATRTKMHLLIPKCGGISNSHTDREAMNMLLKSTQPEYIIPGHLFELSHPWGGGRYGFETTFEIFRKADINIAPLWWGESVYFKP